MSPSAETKQLPSFMQKEPQMADSQDLPTNVDVAARARSGAEAVDALIRERNEALSKASNLARHYDVNRAQIESLERQLSLSEAKLTYYQNLSTSLLTRLSSISMTVEDAMRESRETASRGESLSRPGQVTPQVDQKRLEDLAQRLAPEPQEPMELPK